MVSAAQLLTSMATEAWRFIPAEDVGVPHIGKTSHQQMTALWLLTSAIVQMRISTDFVSEILMVQFPGHFWTEPEVRIESRMRSIQ